jgi:TPR repeat protein
MIKPASLATVFLLVALPLATPASARSDDCEKHFIETYKTHDQDTVKETIRICAAAAKRQDPIGLFYIGRLYHSGIGFEKDSTKAAKWINAASQLGLPKASSFLGRLYGKGDGVPKNDQQAAALFLKAANEGDGVGQYEIGMRYYTGNGIKQNHLEAFKWFTQSIASNQEQKNTPLVKLSTRKRENSQNQLNVAEKKAAEEWQKQWETARGKPLKTLAPSGVAKNL